MLDAIPPPSDPSRSDPSRSAPSRPDSSCSGSSPSNASSDSPSVPFSSTTLTRAELESEITALAGHLNAANHRFLMLIAEFDRREAWGGDGATRSCAHWLSWKCGIEEGAAREKVRVARALEALPLISAAMARGHLSYSKVRALTRVATPETERDLLNIAVSGTAEHVERTVRFYRRALESVELSREAQQVANRGVRYHFDDDGSLVLHARLPAEAGAVLIKALDRALAALRKEKDAVKPADGAVDLEGTESSEHVKGRGAAASGAEDVSAGTRVGTGAAPEAGVAAEAEDEAEDSAAPVAAAASAEGVSAETPVGTEGRAGADDGHGDDDDEDRDRAVAASSAAIAATIAAARRAPPSRYPNGDRPTLAQERADALALFADAFLQHGPGSLSAGDRQQIIVHVDAQTLQQQAAPGRCEIEDGPAIASATARRLACEASVVAVVEDGEGRPLDVGRKTRSIPPAIRRALRSRDQCCQFPGCGRSRWLQGHHIQHWADGGHTKLSNLVHVCHGHHRALHEGGFTIRVLDDGALQFIDPAGRPLQAAVPLHGDLGSIIRHHERHGPGIGPETAVTRWCGERMDYDIAIGCLVEKRLRHKGVSAGTR